MIETERLLFRRFTHDDLPWLIENRSPEPMYRYLGGTTMQNPEALAVRIRFYMDCYDKFGFGMCVMMLKETGEQIGAAGIQPLEDTGEIEVGYNLSQEYWRRGIGYEAAMGWLDFGFNDHALERVVAVAHPDNVGSWKIMEKCGMKYERTEKHYNQDCVVYAISRDEFLNLAR